MNHYTVMYNYRTNKWEMRNATGVVVATFDSSTIPVTETVKFVIPEDTKVEFDLKKDYSPVV